MIKGTENLTLSLLPVMKFTERLLIATNKPVEASPTYNYETS